MNENKKKPKLVIVLEVLFIITLLAAFVENPWFYPDVDGLYYRLILPGILLAIRFVYAIPDIGIAFASAITFLDSIGVSGVPAIALVLLVIIGVLNFTSTDKLWGEALKIIGGFTTGSFAQKASVSISNKKDKKP